MNGTSTRAGNEPAGCIQTLDDFFGRESSANEKDTLLYQMLVCGFSLFFFVVSFVKYNAKVRTVTPGKEHIGKVSLAVLFCWQLCIATFRMFTLSLFLIAAWISTIAAVIFAVILLVHNLLTLFWVPMQFTHFCSDLPIRYKNHFERFANFIFVLVYNFNFENLIDRPSRARYVAFYILIVTEYFVIISFFGLISPVLTPELVKQEYIRGFKEGCFPYALSATFLFFPAGILIMIIYYLKFHPNRKNIASFTDIKKLDSLRRQGNKDSVACSRCARRSRQSRQQTATSQLTVAANY